MNGEPGFLAGFEGGGYLGMGMGGLGSGVEVGVGGGVVGRLEKRLGFGSDMVRSGIV